MIIKNELIRNIAIIAHVDHGKTTLVDGLFRQSGILSADDTTDRIMDSNALERERGITISAKNCAIKYRGVKINIIDTPGHADFGGEVERGLSMVDGVVLLVDAAEGPLPQTRFVLQKAMQNNASVIVVINKVDRQDARSEEVVEHVYDLLLELHGDENILDVPLFYCIGRLGKCGLSPTELEDDLHLLLDAMIDTIPGPTHDDEEPFQMLVSDLSYSEYLGRLAVGKVVHGSAHKNDELVCIDKDNNKIPLRVNRLQSYDGPTFHDTDKVSPGDIIVLSGIENVSIGDTICNKNEVKALERINIDEPTVSMKFMKNISPLSGREGKFVQSTKIFERLQKEALLNVSIRVERDADNDSFIVKGRGEFQLAIIAETMRREGFELCVGKPTILLKQDKNGNTIEPIEELRIDCPESYSGIVMEKLAKRKGLMTDITYGSENWVTIHFEIPTRTLIGYRDEFLTDTKGNGVMNSSLKGWEKHKGESLSRHTGSLISDRSGSAIPYALFHLEPRGRLFVLPGDPVYEGMVIGEHNREVDLYVNPTKTKKLSNMRASGKDEAVTLTPITPMTLEMAMRFIKDDELIEITPSSIRMCKAILSAQQRKVYESRGFIPSYVH